MKIHQLLATVNSQKILENELLLSKIILSKIKLYRHVHNNKLQKLNFLFVLNVKSSYGNLTSVFSLGRVCF